MILSEQWLRAATGLATAHEWPGADREPVAAEPRYGGLATDRGR